MDIDSQLILSLTLYKIASLIVGSLFSYMGYRLFMAGVWEQAGDLKTNFGQNSLVLKNAAPGTFFVFFGAVIIAFVIHRGLELEHIKGASSSLQNKETVVDSKNDGKEKGYELPTTLPSSKAD